jgi:hypothetical protein
MLRHFRQPKRYGVRRDRKAVVVVTSRVAGASQGRQYDKEASPKQVQNEQQSEDPEHVV